MKNKIRVSRKTTKDFSIATDKYFMQANNTCGKVVPMYPIKTDGPMKHFVRSNMYKASNVTFDPKTKTAISYGWWHFVRVIRGKVVFNNYNYSISTQGHQRKVMSVMRKLRIKIDLTVAIPSGLQGVKTLAEAKKLHDENILNKAKEKERRRVERNEAAREQRREYNEKLASVKAKVEQMRALVSSTSKNLADALDIKIIMQPEEAASLAREGKLPYNVRVLGNLSLFNTGIPYLPDGLEIDGDLDLRDSKIMLLPPDLKVKGDLSMQRIPMRKKDMPTGIQIGGQIYR